MARREFAALPYKPDLPPGMTCADCQFFVGCSHVARVSPGTKVCTWGRSRFTHKQRQEMLPGFVERQAEDWAEVTA